LLYNKYIKVGAYPFYIETGDDFHDQLLKTINTILENDFISVVEIDYSHLLKLKKLLMLIAESVPFKPNISELSGKVGINRETVHKYLELLQRANLINMLTADNKGFRRFEKPEKIYLNNCNQLYALSGTVPNIGTIRETYFLQHLSYKEQVTYSKFGDFSVNDNYIFEIGGKSKNFDQIKDLENSFLALDDLEFGIKNKIPLWLFGFLY